MRVLHLGMCCTHGGAEVFVANLAREQILQGLEAEASFRYDYGASALFKDKCDVTFLDEDTLAEYLLRKRFDVLHVTTHAADWVAPAIRASRYNGAVVVTSHACGFYEERLPTDIAIAVSEAVADSIRPIYGEKVCVIHNGIDLDLFYPPKDPDEQVPSVGWVARSNDPMKGLDLLIPFVESAAVSPFQVVVVDGSPEGHDCRDLLPESVSFNSRKNGSEMPAFYRSLAASRGFLLSTSSEEAFGLNIVEAQACGCPVVAPRVGGIPEVIEHQKTGYLYDRTKGVSAIEEAIDWLYADENYGTVSRAALQSVKEHFSSRRMCEQYYEVYVEAIRRHEGRRQMRAVSRHLLLAVIVIIRKLKRIKRRLGRIARHAALQNAVGRRMTESRDICLQEANAVPVSIGLDPTRDGEQAPEEPVHS